MTLNPEPIPVNEPLVRVDVKKSAPETVRRFFEAVSLYLSDNWIKYMTAQSNDISAAPSRIATVELASQGASIAATSIAGDTQAGLYRITYYARITTAAVTSSSLTVTFAWTDGGVSPTISGSAITGNTTVSIQSGTLMVRIDQGTPITYATTYASNGAGEMKYDLSVILERLAA